MEGITCYVFVWVCNSGDSLIYVMMSVRVMAQAGISVTQYTFGCAVPPLVGIGLEALLDDVIYTVILP